MSAVKEYFVSKGGAVAIELVASSRNLKPGFVAFEIHLRLPAQYYLVKNHPVYAA